MDYNSLQLTVTAMGTNMPFWITQFYLPPGGGNIPAFSQPVKADTSVSDPGGMQG